ncbi:MAG: hypothetical protein EAZ95_06340 [Bacteroidetes bacterium]|nr:MAG: hypothetical protein EAZ95_06340 [Bacteroidota bacterium]
MKKNPINDYYALLNLLSQINSPFAKEELNHTQIDNIQYKTRLKNLLLQGSTMSEAQYEAHLQLREELNCLIKKD